MVYRTMWTRAHFLRTGIALGKVSPAKLRSRATKSPALARRLGLLLKLQTGKVDARLLTLARRSYNWTRMAGLGSRIWSRDSRWILSLLVHCRALRGGATSGITLSINWSEPFDLKTVMESYALPDGTAIRVPVTDLRERAAEKVRAVLTRGEVRRLRPVLVHDEGVEGE
jgi:hypothetical protein